MFYLHGWLGFSFIFFKIIMLLMIVFLLLLSVHFKVFADDIDELMVTEEDGIYQVTVSAQIFATEMYVRQVITDYAHAYRINNSIIESEVLESSVSGNIRVRARLLSCVPLFCLEAERVDEVSTLESGDILAVIVPEKSDFHSGRALWRIIPDGDNTQLIYQASIEPSFFIPPIFGTSLFIDTMREQLARTFLRIEQVARINQEREWDENHGVKVVAKRVETPPCKARFDATQR
ncbi:hypothetical protein JYT79_01960 [Cardiobacterium sp. AH-315-I02]|nr:hypothetical protein [Cardiobacterium sp. AH-315-I02]